MKDTIFYRQAELMLRMIPFVAQETCFALKGGTAINLFVRDFLRLSVDIDLVYLPIEDRTTSLAGISSALDRIADRIIKAYPDAQIQKVRRSGSTLTAKLIIRRENVQIKIEPNEVIRGVVFPCSMRSLSPKAEEFFELSASIQTVSLPDLYGGKLCAALDRQHPRDVFDMMMLLAAEGISDEIRQAFVVYLASHDRPMNELLDPPRHDLRGIFENEFQGMTTQPVDLEELNACRETYIASVLRYLTNDERRFLLSIKLGNPEWNLLPFTGLQYLPAIQWKLLNIARMSKLKHAEAIEKLKAKLGL